MQNVEKIKNIIFDLGGVILNIDYQLTVTAFKEIGFDGFENAYSQAAQHQLFDKLETGFISPQEFRDGIRKVAQKDLSDAEIDYAWNKIILDLPAARIALLNQLKTRYRCFLLSNTNKIHYDVYRADLFKLASQDFNEIFEKAYFSHEIHLRKPDLKVFKMVLHEKQLIPSETLFIDDSIQHIEAAKQMGICCHLLQPPQDITEIFDKNYRLLI